MVKRSPKKNKNCSYTIYYKQLLKIKSLQELIILNTKCIICNNDKFIISNDDYDCLSGEFIPLYYNNTWICFSFDEIFDLLYQAIIRNKLQYIPNPFMFSEKLDIQNVNIILFIDRLFYNNKMLHAIKTQKINIIDLLTDMDIQELTDIKNTLNIDTDFGISKFFFWYNEIKSDKILLHEIDNIKVHTYDRSDLKFKLIIDKYKKNPTIDCSKDLKIAIKSFLNKIVEEQHLEIIEEDDDEEY